ncbi:glycosyltransferase [Isoptericola sp. NPDC019482]|uniref:glycosyltransferase family protein n=1 Tax=Isoptericola sp. NPDC019482 TaxID=3154688 RepID=UPI003479B933
MRQIPAVEPETPARRRVAFYSHDTQGLGHVRRTSLLARAVVDADPDVDVLLLSGAREATSLPLPERTEVVTLPRVGKDPDRGYGPRTWSGTLDDVVRVRAGVLDGALAAFRPDVLVVDKVPLGVGGELLPALRRLRAQGGTACVLGLRDVLDTPEVAVREWREQRSTSVVERFFDEVWVYGDARVYDPLTEYALPDHVAARTVFTGYLGRGRASTTSTGYLGRGRASTTSTGYLGRGRAPATSTTAPRPGDAPFVLCLVGGGQDGAALAEAFAAASLPAGHRGVLVTGPYLPEATRDRLRAVAAGRDDLDVRAFVRDVVPLVEGAAAVVTMGGYNSVCELLASGHPGLVVPRTHPRAEQLVRACRLAGLGLLDVLVGAITPERVGAWLARATDGDARRRPEVDVDLDGLARVPHLVDGLVERLAAAAPTTAPDQQDQQEEEHRATA